MVDRDPAEKGSYHIGTDSLVYSMELIKGYKMDEAPELVRAYHGPRLCPECDGDLRMDFAGNVLLVTCEACSLVVGAVYRGPDSKPITLLRHQS